MSNCSEPRRSTFCLDDTCLARQAQGTEDISHVPLWLQEHHLCSALRVIVMQWGSPGCPFWEAPLLQDFFALWERPPHFLFISGVCKHCGECVQEAHGSWSPPSLTLYLWLFSMLQNENWTCWTHALNAVLSPSFCFLRSLLVPPCHWI